MKKLRIKQDYDKTATIYNKRYAKIQFSKFKILDSIKLGKRILDLGCGSGLLKDYLKIDLIGMDLSLEMCKLSKEKEVCGDIDYLPFKDSVFDEVLSFTAIQNLPSFNKVFKEVKRILRGKLAVITILKKKYSESLLKFIISEGFKIKEYELGEDIGFILQL